MKKFKFIIDGSKYEVSVEEIENNVASIEVNGTPFTVEIEKEEKAVKTTTQKPTSIKPTATTSTAGTVVGIKSPLPGSIMKILVSEGQSVKRGDTLLTMESMKMENNIVAEQDGVVKSIFVESGKNVLQDELLLEITTSATTTSPAPQPAPKPSPAPKPIAKTEPTAGGISIKAPLPGSVVKVVVSVGQSVKRGDTLLILESMKMENSILAEQDGVVKSVAVSAGQSVMQDDVLVTME